MPDTKITALTALTAADPANDVLPIVDVSDTTMAASGTTKKISVNNILGCSGTATLASATITGDLTVATDQLKVNTGSTAVQIGATTQTQIGTTAWPSDLISKANSRVLVGNLGTLLCWNESTPAIGNASTLYIGAKSGAGATTFGGGSLNAGTENASNRAGFLAFSTIQSNGIERERYRIDSNGAHTWTYVGGTAGTQMTLDSSGNLGLGCTPSAWAGGKAFEFGTGTANASVSSLGDDTNITSNAYYNAGWKFAQGTYLSARYRQNASNHQWFTSSTNGGAGTAITYTQAMTLTSGGNLLVGTTAGLSSERFFVQAGASNTYTATFLGITSSTTSNGILLGLGGNRSTDSTYSLINYVDTDGTGTPRFRITGNGNVLNTNNSYGALSDIKLKENIVDAKPKLDDLLRVRVRNFNFKSDPNIKHIGVIAQELERVFPSMIETSIDLDENGKDVGTVTKSVKYSVFVPMLIKAIQELTARVQTLETR